ncbi:putative reverse transcriptase domain-containing protein [Tanacetum coccineum]
MPLPILLFTLRLDLSIPSEDPLTRRLPQFVGQAPRSPEYVPDPIELEDHVPVYIPEPEHPEDLVPAEDEAPTPLLPPFFLSPRIRPLSPRALAAEMRDIASSFHHSLHPSGTPPLLPIPLPAPSTSRRADIPEADTPPRRDILITLEMRFRDTERRMMTALEMVNMRVSYQVDVRSRESSEFHSRHHDAQTDRAAVRAEIEVLRRERLAYEQESIQTRQDLASVRLADDLAVPAIHAYPRPGATMQSVKFYGLLPASRRYRSFVLKMAPKRTTRSTPVTPAPTETTTTVTEAQLQALIDQGVAAAMAEAEASMVRNGYNSNGTEGVVGLTRWFEKMESVFSISNCTASCQVKFATCTLQDDALTWWNAHVKTTTLEAAHAMPCATLKKMMADKYCPRGEIKKIETEMWNLKVKGTDVVAYSRRFQQLALMCSRMFPEEIDKIEKPLCPKCNYHHDGPCAPKCYKCNKYGHIARDCRGTGNANNNNHKGTGSGQKPTCFECGAQGHFKKECPRLKNNKGNRGNQAGNDRAPAKVYVVGNAGTNPDNVVAGTFLLNNRYAYILFDTGADRSFVSTTFSSQIDITPSTLDHYYDVELADGRIIGLNTILKGCTLNFLNHQFNINLMPVELGSFDAIIGMDWLAKHQAVIACAEKIVRIPWKNKTLIIHGDGSTQGNVTRLNIISCTKTQKYMEKGFPIFLAHVTTKEIEDKSEKKRLEDVPIVQDFPEVFPEDLPGLPPTRQVEFQKLAPSHMKELTEQLKAFR